MGNIFQQMTNCFFIIIIIIIIIIILLLLLLFLSQETGLDISCKLSPGDTICKVCQSCFLVEYSSQIFVKVHLKKALSLSRLGNIFSRNIDFFIIIPGNWIWQFMQIVSMEDNLHGMSNSVFW